MVRIVQTGDDGVDTPLGETKKLWLIDTFDSVVEQFESDRNIIVADAESSGVRHYDELG